MYAVIDLGGKQYKVEKGDEVVVDRLETDEGKTVTFSPVLIGGEKQGVTSTELKGAKVKAKVEEHFLGDKLLVFKYKPKQGYRRRQGHRSRLSRISIQTITAGGAKTVQKAKPEKAKEAAGEEEAASKAKPAKAKAEGKSAAKAEGKTTKAKAPGKASKAKAAGAAKEKKSKAKPAGEKKAKAKPKAKAKSKAKPKSKTAGKKASGSAKKTEK